MKAKKFPDTLLIVSLVLVLFTVLSWIIPAGEFEREIKNGKEILIADSFKEIDSNPQFYGLFTAPLRGIVSASEIIAFVFIVGGAFQIIHKTGALNSGLFTIIKYSEKNRGIKVMVIPILMFLFSLGGATFGMAEEVLVFLMVTIPLSQALGYDPLVGVAIPFIGAGVGFAGAFLNPFTVGIAQGIAEINPLFSGIEFRIISWLLLTTISIAYVMRYANKIVRNPSKSITGTISYDIDLSLLKPEEIEFNKRRKTIVFLLFFSIVILILGVNKFDWYINEISALFLVLGIVSALIYKLSTTNTITAFTDGAKMMITPALIIGFAKGALLIAQDANIIDTVLNFVAGLTGDLSKQISVNILFLIQSGINFLVPSGSGQAALTMPVIAPLADILEINRQSAVLAYQFGDGITNFIIPTSGVTMGILEIAKIPYNKWLLWIMPLILLLYLACILLLAISVTFKVW